MSAERTYFDDALTNDAPEPVFELDAAPAPARASFVAGVGAPWIPISRFRASPIDADESIASLAPPASSAFASRVLEATRTVPFAVWKRVPTYAFLTMLLGNGCRCGGLSLGTNVALAVLLVVGLAGLCASFSAPSLPSSGQRSP